MYCGYVWLLKILGENAREKEKNNKRKIKYAKANKKSLRPENSSRLKAMNFTKRTNISNTKNVSGLFFESTKM